ncbi:transcription antitermination factor NusB [Rubidibacter lacunae KORDI 51-2]|uniref:Transcription antitermination protein NusB n=1 Tax=Rubidibacter lacunae KORDI 51-2 TaxID=582515 RepID=U5DLW4_9CHRO|nr:transcription antitermination factor NusB [Rubidibacter lacunae]ERN40700.1 transcription antitermination factor NusB [Rubidibacter lacunae KORDI 51-2]
MPRLQPRSIARELALLAQSQLRLKSDKLDRQSLEQLVSTSIRALIGEVQESLEVAAAEVQRAQDRLLTSATRTTTVEGAKAMTAEAIALTQAAINRLGSALELPQFVQMAERDEVRQYALTLLSAIGNYREAIDERISAALVDWQLHRLARIDRDLLRLAVAEMVYLGVPVRVAIDEAVELGKRYSDENGYRFVNGVLRRASDRLKTEQKADVAPHAPTDSADESKVG